MSLPTFPFAILQIPSYILQLKRSLLPKSISDTPYLLQHGTLVDARDHTSHIAKGAIKYAEDAVIWPRNKIVIFSTDPGRGVFNAFTGEGDEDKAGNGYLMTWTIGSNDINDVKELRLDDWPAGRSFHPLGITIFDIPGSNGSEAYLAAANCMSQTCCIEIFKLSYSPELPHDTRLSATYLHDLAHPSITAPNALVILSNRQVLFTNSFKYPPRKSLFLNTLEQSLSIPGGSVQLLTYDSAQKTTVCETVIPGIAFANGLAINNERTILAVASSTAHYVKLYDLVNIEHGVTSPGQFQLRRTVHVGMTPDNLRFLDSDDTTGTSGVLLCAGHPRVLDFVKVAKNPSDPFRSPSKVVKIKVPKQTNPSSTLAKIRELFTNQDVDATTIFECQGSFYGTSSTAVAYASSNSEMSMIVCGLFEDGILVCNGVDLGI